MNEPVVLVTGASGLIGTRLVQALAREQRVLALDVKPPQDVPPGVSSYECDLTDDAAVRRAMGRIRAAHGERLASVIHLAAYYDFSGEASPLYEELTVEGTRRLLRELRGFSCEQFVFSSTLLAMQPAPDTASELDETWPLRAEWDYPRSKLAAERVIAGERGEIPAVILRIAGVYDDDGHCLPVGQQVLRIYEKTLESYFFPGDAAHGQPFVHLDDLVACFLAVVRRRALLDPFEVFLIAEPDTLSYRELQDELGRLIHGERWPTLEIPKPLAKAAAWVKDKAPGMESFVKPWMIDLADDHYAASIERARLRLDWKPTRRLRQTLPRIVAALERDPAAFYRQLGLDPPAELDARPGQASGAA